MSQNTNNPADLDTESKVERAQQALGALLSQGAPVCVSWSAGKDSSAMLNLVLTTAAGMKAEGRDVPPIVVTHADTMIENPEMTLYARNEMLQVKAFARRHHLDVAIEVATPILTNQWAVRVIGGRGLPPFPGTNRDCTVDFKIDPMKKLRKAVLKHLAKRTGAAEIEPVVLIGTRYDESTTRAANMRERGESDVQVRRGIDENGKPSHLFLSPLAHWATDDIWMYLGLVRGGAMEGYSDFEDTIRLYADAMGQSCVIVAEDMSKAMKTSKACGARHGCSQCTVASVDQSMENMLATDERYAYMRGLNKLRNFISATRWDMERRSWVGRTIKEGYVRISPDAYSPAMMEDLLRYALTLDVQEREAASDKGISPRFQLIGVDQLLAIDAMWSLQAFHRPFHALKIFREIENGARFPVPEVSTFERPKQIPVRFLWVGDNWDEGDRMAYTGLRSVLHEMTDGGGCMGTRELADGRTVLDVETAELMQVETETAFFVLDEADELIARYHDNKHTQSTAGYMHYLQLGVISIKSGLQGEVDNILRRSAFKERQGIAGPVNWRDFWDRAVTPEEAGLTANGDKKRVRGEDGSRSVAHSDLFPVANPIVAPPEASQVALDFVQKPERMSA